MANWPEHGGWVRDGPLASGDVCLREFSVKLLHQEARDLQLVEGKGSKGKSRLGSKVNILDKKLQLEDVIYKGLVYELWFGFRVGASSIVNLQPFL